MTDLLRNLLFVALGGALGALSRFGVSHLVHGLLPGRFPFATLAINLSGSFLMGVLYVLISERGVLHPDWRSIAMVGFLGAFTTFSTFSLEAVTLFGHGLAGQALVYMLASTCLCVGAAWAAITLTRLMFTF